jgi:hypothetical protein
MQVDVGSDGAAVVELISVLLSRLLESASVEVSDGTADVVDVVELPSVEVSDPTAVVSEVVELSLLDTATVDEVDVGPGVSDTATEEAGIEELDAVEPAWLTDDEEGGLPMQSPKPGWHPRPHERRVRPL